MHRYPIFISLASLRILVAGAGTVGMRKIASLTQAGAGDILVLDPALSRTQQRELEAMPGVHAASRTAAREDIIGKSLVFAATDNAGENAGIAEMCAALGILCNVATSPEQGSFHVPAVAVARELMIAVSSGGHSPALAKRIKEEGAVWLETGYGPLSVFMKRLRPLVLDLRWKTAENSALFRSIVHSGLDRALVPGGREPARGIAFALLPPELHGCIEELLDGLC